VQTRTTFFGPFLFGCELSEGMTMEKKEPEKKTTATTKPAPTVKPIVRPAAARPVTVPTKTVATPKTAATTKTVARQSADEPIVRIYMRYDRSTHLFIFMPGEDVPTMEFPESAISQIRAMMLADPKDGQGRADAFDFLVTEAKKDPEGRFVSVSNAPAEEGQAGFKVK
jgi:hypothetical protein